MLSMKVWRRGRITVGDEDLVVGSSVYARRFISSPPVWKSGEKGAVRGRRSERRVSRKGGTRLEFSRSWPEGGSAE